MRGNREEKRANEAESRLSDIERFIRLSGASEAYEHWNLLHAVVKKAAQALADWAIAQHPSSIMTMNAPLARASLPNASLTVSILAKSLIV